MEQSKTIVVFDFDGTLTTKDTLFEFIRFAKGNLLMLIGLCKCAFVLIKYKLGYISNHTAKEFLFAHYFAGMTIDEFDAHAKKFAKRIETIENFSQMKLLCDCLRNGNEALIISASIWNWIEPWATSKGISTVLATEVEVINGRLSGRFSTPNCYGQEKVNRLLDKYPQRESYFLVAYGDSEGDRPLLDFANEGHFVK